MTDSKPAPMLIPGRLVRLAQHGYALLALVCVALWLPGLLSLPALDRDESRFAQSSRQMLDSGNYVDIRFGQVPRYKKPVGIYWLQAAATVLAGRLNPAGQSRSHIWTYRLPSLLGGVAAVWLTCWLGSLFSAEAGLLAGLMMAASLLLAAEAIMATTDAVQLAAIALMQGVLLRIYRAAKEGMEQPSTSLVLAGWAGLAVGILVKGPVAPAVAAATIVALIVWDRDWKWLKKTKPLPSIALVLLITAPWGLAIALESRGAFFQQSLGGDFAAKVAGGQEGHGALPGYYLLLSALTFWPAILFVLPGIALALTRRNQPLTRFLLAWAGAWWLAVELVPTKLPNYVLPAFPPLAILASLWLLAPRHETGWRRWLPFIAAFQFLLGLCVIAAAPLLLPKYYALLPPTLFDNASLAAFVIAACLCGLIALILVLTGRRLVAFAPALIAALIQIPTLTAWSGPGLDRLWVSPRLAALVAKNRGSNDPPPMLAGYEEPSLVFALGADVDLTDGRGAAERGAQLGGLALVDDEERPRFLARLAEVKAQATMLDDLSGFNYSRGHATHVTLYRVAPLGPQSIPQAR
jgi:4-amino-4-deoxy-L-arabinose transferase-like glycosyltransferase